MQLFIALLCTFAASLVFADESKPWPQKGDTVFVAAKLEGFNPATVIFGGYGTKMPDVPTLEPCSPATAKKVSDESLILRDDGGNDRKLLGAWSALLFRTEKECRAKQETGPVRVKSEGGWRYSLVAESPAPTADEGQPTTTEDRPFPQDGDTVYVSSVIQARLSEYVGEARPVGQVPIKACVPLKVTHRKSKGQYPGWGMETEERLYAGFRGERWPERFHRTENECLDVHARLGDASTASTEGVNVYGSETGAPKTPAR